MLNIKDESKLRALNNRIKQIYNPSYRNRRLSKSGSEADELQNRESKDEASIITGTDTYDSESNPNPK